MAKTASEVLFDQYLTEAEIEFDYEESIPGKTKRPDYRVRWRGEDLFFEVKQFESDVARLLSGPGFYDPYGPVREKINAAARQFGEYKHAPCSVVLYNCGGTLVHLDSPTSMFGAMLGKDLGSSR